MSPFEVLVTATITDMYYLRFALLIIVISFINAVCDWLLGVSVCLSVLELRVSSQAMSLKISVGNGHTN